MVSEIKCRQLGEWLGEGPPPFFCRLELFQNEVLKVCVSDVQVLLLAPIGWPCTPFGLYTSIWDQLVQTIEIMPKLLSKPLFILFWSNFNPSISDLPKV